MGLAPIVMLMGFLLRWGPVFAVEVVAVEVREPLAESKVVLGADVERDVAVVETGGVATDTRGNEGIDKGVVVVWSIELLTPTVLLSL